MGYIIVVVHVLLLPDAWVMMTFWYMLLQPGEDSDIQFMASDPAIIIMVVLSAFDVTPMRRAKAIYQETRPRLPQMGIMQEKGNVICMAVWQ